MSHYSAPARAGNTMLSVSQVRSGAEYQTETPDSLSQLHCYQWGKLSVRQIASHMENNIICSCWLPCCLHLPCARFMMFKLWPPKTQFYSRENWACPALWGFNPLWVIISSPIYWYLLQQLSSECCKNWEWNYLKAMCLSLKWNSTMLTLHQYFLWYYGCSLSCFLLEHK